MHGAAQSEQSDDPEGDIVVAIREIVGEDVPITVGLDLHANISERMVRNANTISIYQRYPHVDVWETGERAARLCLGALLLLPLHLIETGAQHLHGLVLVFML